MTAEGIPHSSRHGFLQLPRALRPSLVFGKLSVLSSSSATRDITPSKGSYQRAKMTHVVQLFIVSGSRAIL